MLRPIFEPSLLEFSAYGGFHAQLAAHFTHIWETDNDRNIAFPQIGRINCSDYEPQGTSFEMGPTVAVRCEWYRGVGETVEDALADLADGIFNYAEGKNMLLVRYPLCVARLEDEGNLKFVASAKIAMAHMEGGRLSA